MQADTDLGEAVLERAVTAYAGALGDRLVAVYALGSLAHGGFSPLVSDVDLGLILADPLRAGDRATIGDVAGAVRASGPGLPERLSVFWGTPSTLSGQVPGGRFPPLDRLDLLEHGRLLTGRDAREAAARPDRTELLVAGARFALGSLSGTGTGSGPPADASVLDEIAAPSRLVSRGPRRLTKVVLFPVRFLYTAATGQAGLTALAVEHYLATRARPPPRWSSRPWPGARSRPPTPPRRPHWPAGNSSRCTCTTSTTTSRDCSRPASTNWPTASASGGPACSSE